MPRVTRPTGYDWTRTIGRGRHAKGDMPYRVRRDEDDRTDMAMQLNNRYDRNMPALSPEECATLMEKRVCIIGCGGLGGFIIELLARAGVGALNVIDNDVFEATNLNRQLLSEEENLGSSKAEAAALRIASINSDVKVKAVHGSFTAENAAEILKGCDLAIDALDNVDSRLVLEKTCTEAGIHLVHGAISGFSAQVSVVAPGSGTLSNLYPKNPDKHPSRGNLGFVAAACASIQVSEAIKLLCGRPSALLGKLLIIDFRTMEFTKIDM